jgi:hypothetical protein
MAIGTAAAIVGGSLISGALGSKAAGKAASAQQAGAEAGIAEQRRQFDLTQEQFEPFRQAGVSALEQQRILLGLGGTAADDPNQARRGELQSLISQAQQGQAADGSQPVQDTTDPEFQQFLRQNQGRKDFAGIDGPELLRREFESTQGRAARTSAQPQQQQLQSLQAELAALPAPVAALSNQEQQAQAFAAFSESPGQKFLRERGQRNLVRNAAAIGGLGGGNVREALVQQGVGFAQQDFQNQFSRLGQLAGQGQAATTSIGQFGSQASGNVANLQQVGASARSSGILGQNQALQQGIGGAFTGLAQGGLFGGNQFTNRFGGAGQNPVAPPLATPFGGR